MAKKEVIRTLDIMLVLIILGLLVILIIAFVLATITLLIFFQWDNKENTSHC